MAAMNKGIAVSPKMVNGNCNIQRPTDGATAGGKRMMWMTASHRLDTTGIWSDSSLFNWGVAVETCMDALSDGELLLKISY